MVGLGGLVVDKSRTAFLSLERQTPAALSFKLKTATKHLMIELWIFFIK